MLSIGIQPKAINNARDDKLRTSPFWKKSFAERRCLIPAPIFCEAKGRNPATYVWFGVTGADALRPSPWPMLSIGIRPISAEPHGRQHQYQ